MPTPPETWQPPACDRIREHTSDASNQRIDRATLGALEEASHAPDVARRRLAELDREWTVDRAVMLNFGIVGAITAFKTMQSFRRGDGMGGWGLFFWAQMGFLVNHAIRGWCPPLPVFRRLGFRSDKEIAAERVALETTRG